MLFFKNPSHRISKFQSAVEIAPHEVDEEAAQGIADTAQVLCRQPIGMSGQTPMGEDMADTSRMGENGKVISVSEVLQEIHVNLFLGVLDQEGA